MFSNLEAITDVRGAGELLHVAIHLASFLSHLSDRASPIDALGFFISPSEAPSRSDKELLRDNGFMARYEVCR